MINPDIKQEYAFRSILVNRAKTDLVVIHHSESPSDTSPLDIHKWHLDNGWCGIGYHFLVNMEGNSINGRPYYTIGSHCKGQNDHSIGICLIGDFDIVEPSENQLMGLDRLLEQLRKEFTFTIGLHCEYNPKSCPGKFAVPLLRQRYLI